MRANCKLAWTETTDGRGNWGYVLADKWTTAALDRNFIDMHTSSVTELNISGDWIAFVKTSKKVREIRVEKTLPFNGIPNAWLNCGADVAPSATGREFDQNFEFGSQWPTKYHTKDIPIISKCWNTHQ